MASASGLSRKNSFGTRASEYLNDSGPNLWQSRKNKFVLVADCFQVYRRLFTGYLPVICSQGSTSQLFQWFYAGLAQYRVSKNALRTDGRPAGRTNRWTDGQTTDQPTSQHQNNGLWFNSCHGFFQKIKLLVSKKTLICLSNFPLVKKILLYIFIPSLIYTIKRYDLSAFWFLILSTLNRIPQHNNEMAGWREKLWRSLSRLRKGFRCGKPRPVDYKVKADWNWRKTVDMARRLVKRTEAEGEGGWNVLRLVGGVK